MCRYDNCRYAECHYAESQISFIVMLNVSLDNCRYAECRYPECCGALEMAQTDTTEEAFRETRGRFVETNAHA